jgi:hypothetical protein
MAAGASTPGCAGRIDEATRHEAVDASADAKVGDPALPEAGAATGQVGVSLSVSGDSSSVASVTYTLSNGVTTYSGGTQVNAGTVAGFVILRVAPGVGYVVSVTVTTMDGNVCTGQSAPVTVASGQTASAAVQATCEWALSPCPVWNTIVADPPAAGLPPNDKVLITVNATGPDPAAALTFAFRVTAGAGSVGDEKTVSSSPSNAIGQATFTCPARMETDTIEVVVGESDLPDGGECPPSLTTGTVTATCTGAPIEAGVDASANDQ